MQARTLGYILAKIFSEKLLDNDNETRIAKKV